jgi:hypothetical protein
VVVIADEAFGADAAAALAGEIEVAVVLAHAKTPAESFAGKCVFQRFT